MIDAEGLDAGVDEPVDRLHGQVRLVCGPVGRAAEQHDIVRSDVGPLEVVGADRAAGPIREIADHHLAHVGFDGHRRDVRAVFEDHFFGPLGLAVTRFCENGTPSDRRAIGYETEGSETPAEDWGWLPLTTGPHGIGLLCTSVEDMYLWGQGLRLGKVINKDSIATMFTPYFEVEPVGSFGYGWWVGGLNTSEDGR